MCMAQVSSVFPKRALNYAKEAQEINNSEDIKEVISNIEHAKQTKRKPFKSNLLILESNN